MPQRWFGDDPALNALGNAPDLTNSRYMKIRTTTIALVIAALMPQPVFSQGVKGALLKRAAAWILGGAAVAGGAAATYAVLNPKDVEAELAAKIQQDLDNKKDDFFHKIHPVGTAKSIQVHEVKSHWKTDKPKSLADLTSYEVRYTIYWDGPIQKDGYTKLTSTYDAEVGRYVDTTVIATTGVTNGDAVDASIEFLTAFLASW